MERAGGERDEQAGAIPEEQDGVPVRQPNRRKVRREPALGSRHGGDTAHGGGGVGEAEAVLQPHRQLVRAEPQVRRVHAGGVEEVGGARVRSSVVRERGG